MHTTSTPWFADSSGVQHICLLAVSCISCRVFKFNFLAKIQVMQQAAFVIAASLT